MAVIAAASATPRLQHTLEFWPDLNEGAQTPVASTLEKLCEKCAAPLLLALLAPATRGAAAALLLGGGVRGGSDASSTTSRRGRGPTLGDLDKQQTPEAKRNEGMKKGAAMMRQMGGKGEAIDKLEAAAARGDASEAELIELYMLARREQAKALVDPAAGDHLAQALRMIACESEEHLDGGRLPSAAHERVMDAIAGDLEMSRADFEKELAAKSDENAGQILEVLRDEGFVAKVQRASRSSCR